MTTNLETRQYPPGATVAREVSDDAPRVQTWGPQSAQPSDIRLHEVGPGPSAHDAIDIGSLLDPRLRMRHRVTLNIKPLAQGYVALCEQLEDVCGNGADPIRAVQDMRQSIATLYWRLKDYQGAYEPDREAWQRLSAIVYEA